MSVIEIFSKKKIVDIKKDNDTIDKEYMLRIMRIQNRQDLIDLLKDYEEFIPQALQKFRECDDEEFKQLMFQAERFYEQVKAGQPTPSEPTEAIIFMQPPMLAIPRMMARTMSRENNRYVTWGEAFLEISSSGFLEKMIRQQERIMHHIIEIKAQVEEVFNTTGQYVAPSAEIPASRDEED